MSVASVTEAALFEEPYLSQFLRELGKRKPEVTRTRVPQAYWSDLPINVTLPDTKLSREEVRAHCRRPDTDDLSRLLTVIAWGVARTPNRNRMFVHRHRILEAMAASRKAACPVESYRLYREAAVPGLRPAYWTKLIHFCEPSGTGYILDRFTALSADLLMAKPLRLSRRNGVPRSIDEHQYAGYCEFVRALASRMSAAFGREVLPDEAELSMYAGRGHPWRNFLKAPPRCVRLG